MKSTQINSRHTTTYRLRFTGGLVGALAITVAAVTVFLLPIAIIMLLTSTDLEKFERREPAA